MPLHPDIDSVVSHLRINMNTAETLVRGLSAQQFNWRPEAGRWSVAECIGHLNLINGADLGQLRAAIEAARSKGMRAPGPFQYGWFSRKFVSMIEPPVTKKFNAPKQYVPPSEAELDATLAEYRRVTNAIIELAESARGLNLSKVKTGLSGVPLIKMAIGGRLSLLATHDTRHLWQADQVMKTAGFPAT